jgi:uncharacterized protein (UPF0332 family)
MKPEAADLLGRAREDLDDARKIAEIGLVKVAARCAYYAAFHAAEALIVEAAGKIVKTHTGVRAEFARLAKATPQIDRSLTILGEGVYLQGNQRLRRSGPARMSSWPMRMTQSRTPSDSSIV